MNDYPHHFADSVNALSYLRQIGETGIVSWGVVSDLITLHCEGQIPSLEQQIRHRNTTGLGNWLDELAEGETQSLPGRMSDREDPLSPEEGVRAAHRIVLLRALAQAARALHTRDMVSIET